MMTHIEFIQISWLYYAYVLITVMENNNIGKIVTRLENTEYRPSCVLKIYLKENTTKLIEELKQFRGTKIPFSTIIFWVFTNLSPL